MKTSLPLSVLFPELPWSQEADVFLTEIALEKMPLIEQLKKRDVKCVRFDFYGTSKGYLTIQDQNFVIVINHFSRLSQQMITMGHEIGHTFHIDPKTFLSPQEYREIESRDLERHRTTELFATVFSRKWKSLQTKDEFCALIRSVPDRKKLRIE